jgi:hypothetical protein
MNFPSVTALPQGFDTLRPGAPIPDDHHALFQKSVTTIPVIFSL